MNLHVVASLQNITLEQDILLVPMNEGHAKELLAILDKDQTIRDRVTVAARLRSVEDVAKEVVVYKNDEGIIRYVITKQSKVVGLVSLWRDSGFFGTLPNPNDYGFGYFLDPEYRGKGIVTTVVKSLIDCVSKALPVHQFVAFCEDNNQASAAILKKLDFKETNQTFKEPNHGWVERKYVFTPQSAL